ncbi:MAG: AAA family ATPase [Planctomycetota bacterium]|nr:AAA family ATPase [Planctomycetota bacterium]
MPHNVGDVVEDRGDRCLVHFRSPPPECVEATKEIGKKDLFLDGQPLATGGSTAERSFRINIVTSHDLATGDFQAEYFIENVLPVAQDSGLFAPQKSLKTTIKADALISLAIGPGALFLGRFPVLRQARCLDLNGESGMGSTQEIAKRICASKGVALESLDHLLWSENLPRFDNPLHLIELDRVIRGEGVEFVAFDCAYLCIPGDNAGNVFAQGELLRDISILCREAGATLMLLHHTKKASISYEPPELSDASWSGFAEFVRSWILLARREKYVPGTGEHKLWVSIGGSLGHQSLSALDVQEGLRTDSGGRRWDVVLQNADEARSEAKQAAESRRAEQASQKHTDDCRKMLEALRRCSTGDTMTALRGLAGLSGTRAADAIRTLVGEQRAEQVEITKYKRKEVGYRIIEN